MASTSLRALLSHQKAGVTLLLFLCRFQDLLTLGYLPLANHLACSFYPADIHIIVFLSLFRFLFLKNVFSYHSTQNQSLPLSASHLHIINTSMHVRSHSYTYTDSQIAHIHTHTYTLTQQIHAHTITQQPLTHLAPHTQSCTYTHTTTHPLSEPSPFYPTFFSFFSAVTSECVCICFYFFSLVCLIRRGILTVLFSSKRNNQIKECPGTRPVPPCTVLGSQ